MSFLITFSSFRLQSRAPTPGWPPSGPGLSVTRASGLRPALQCRQPLQLTSLREGPPSAQSFTGHQTGAACPEGPQPGDCIFNGPNLVLDSDARGKTPSAVGLIPHPGAFLGEVVLGKEMGAQWPLQSQSFLSPTSFTGPGQVGLFVMCKSHSTPPKRHIKRGLVKYCYSCQSYKFQT